MVPTPSTSSLPSPPSSATPASELSDTAFGFPDKDRFYYKVEQHIQSRKIKAVLTADEILEIARLISNPAELKGHPNLSYRKWIQKHFVLRKTSMGGSVVAHRTKGELVAKEHLYDTLLAAHAKEPHGGRDKTTREIHNANRWILKGLVELFVKSCPTCHVRNEAATRSRAATIAANGDVSCDKPPGTQDRGGVGPMRNVRSQAMAGTFSHASPYARYRSLSEMPMPASASPSSSAAIFASRSLASDAKHKRNQSAVLGVELDRYCAPNTFNYTPPMPSVVIASPPNVNLRFHEQPQSGPMTIPGATSSGSDGPFSNAGVDLENVMTAGMTFQSSSVYQAPPPHKQWVQSYLNAIGDDIDYSSAAARHPDASDLQISPAFSHDHVLPVPNFTVPLLNDSDSFYRFSSFSNAFKNSWDSDTLGTNQSPYTPSICSIHTSSISQPNSAASIMPPPPFCQQGFEGLFTDFALGASIDVSPVNEISKLPTEDALEASMGQWDDLFLLPPPPPRQNNSLSLETTGDINEDETWYAGS